MELRQLTTFATVARVGSVTRAADKLSYAQSTVSAQIQALETELGVRLFDRLGKQVVLTDSGRRLEQYACRLLGLAEEARVAVAAGDEPRGRLTISSYETLCTYRLPPVLQAYRKRYPQVQLAFRPSMVSDVYRPIREGGVDVAFVMAPPLQASDLNIEPLATEPMYVLAPPEHPLAVTGRITLEDFREVPLLLTEPGCGYRAPVERALAKAGIRMNTVMEFSNLEAIKQCVMVGMGLTILPAVAVARERAEGRLIALEWEGHDNLEIVTQMIWHKEKWLSPAMSAFLRVAQEVLVAEEEERPLPEPVAG